jgi:hypothetical protein
MNIQLLVNGKSFPMIVKSFDITDGAGWTKINAPTLTRAESAALDEHVGNALGFYDMFSDSVTYLYIEGQMTANSFGDGVSDEIPYQITLDGAPVDYSTLNALIN